MGSFSSPNAFRTNVSPESVFACVLPSSLLFNHSLL